MADRDARRALVSSLSSDVRGLALLSERDAYTPQPAPFARTVPRRSATRTAGTSGRTSSSSTSLSRASPDQLCREALTKWAYSVGFSYADNGESVNNSPDSAKDVWAFLQLFYSTFPEYAKLPFHVAAESYGGTYACAYRYVLPFAPLIRCTDRTSAASFTSKTKSFALRLFPPLTISLSPRSSSATA